MFEIWKDIIGYETIYQVSNFGRVRSLDRVVYIPTNSNRRIKGRILRLFKNRDGYLIVQIYKDGKGITYLVHRLVALAFVPNPYNYETVNHINENKLDNRACNLEWMSVPDNIRYGTGLERSKKSRSKSGMLFNRKDLSRAVICVETDEVYMSIMDVERRLGLNNSRISACCRGKKNYKTCGGYHWKYLEEENSDSGNTL